MKISRIVRGCCLLTAALVLLGKVSARAQDSNLSLRETIRQVAEVTNVLPLDVYAGTTISEYRDWDCRYDLTYKEFRPNYVLYLTARRSSVEEVLECVDELSIMSPKEKALTCATLITFVTQRNDEPSCLLLNDETSVVALFNEEQKRIVLQKLKEELNNRQIAFPKIEGEEQNLSLQWEENIRKECYSFMKLPNRAYQTLRRADDGKTYPVLEPTARNSCCDLYVFPQTREKEENRFYEYDDWNNESKQLPIKFLCATVLAQAAYDASQLCRLQSFLQTSNEQVLNITPDVPLERFLVAERFLSAPWTVAEGKEFDSLYCIRQAIGEGLVMNAYLRTQYVASRLGMLDADVPISGNSFTRDVSVCEVVQKAIDALTVEFESNLKDGPQKEARTVEDLIEFHSQTSLLETIRMNSEKLEFFTIGNFIYLFKYVDSGLYNSQKPNDGLQLPLTYERFRPWGMIYESAKKASRTEIVECLKDFSELSVMEKALVLESTSLYLWRSENPALLENKLTVDMPEPLSDDEKRLFAQVVLDCCKDDRAIVVPYFGVERFVDMKGRREVLLWLEESPDVNGVKQDALKWITELREEWKNSFRNSVLELQKVLGKRNPYYVYDSKSEEMWQCVCNEAPIVLLNSILSMELLLNIDELKLTPRQDYAGIDKNDVRKQNETVAEEEFVQKEINIMKCYLFAQSNLRKRIAFFPVHSNTSVGPRVREYYSFPEVTLYSVACSITRRFPQIQKGGIPRFDNNKP